MKAAEDRLIAVSNKLNAIQQELMTTAQELSQIAGGNDPGLEYNPSGWPLVTPKQLREKCGLKATAFCGRLHHSDCPVYYARYGKHGRMIELQPNMKLIEWLKRPVRK